MASLPDNDNSEEFMDNNSNVQTEKAFVPTGKLKLPDDIQLPSTVRMNNLIEKTATFINKHGAQMEILIKAKQANNPQFDFLNYDSPLNKYYKFLVAAMKSGEYVPNVGQSNESDGSDDEDHYLHPSLLGQSKANRSSQKLFLPQLPRVANENSSYSQLVKSLKDKIIKEPERKPKEEKVIKMSTDSQPLSINNDPINTGHLSILPAPPHEVQLYINKLAEYVAKKGESFEQTIRKRNEARFEFLNPGNLFHGHYLKRKLHFLEEKRKAQAEELMKNSSNNDSQTEKVPVSFNLNVKDKKKLVGSLVNDNDEEEEKSCQNDSLSNDDDSFDITNGIEDLGANEKPSSLEKQTKEKQLQEERRRKAALFLSLLKKRQIENKEETENVSNSFSRKLTNSAKSSFNDDHSSSPSSRSPRPDLSPTIEAVTSPNSSPRGELAVNDNSSLEALKHRSNETNRASLLPFMSIDKRDKSPHSPRSPHSRHKHNHGHKHHHHHHRHRRHHHHDHRGKHFRRSRSHSRSQSPSHSRSRSHSRSPNRKCRRRRRS